MSYKDVVHDTKTITTLWTKITDYKSLISMKLSPPKAEFLDKFMINLSIQNSISFLVLPLFPSELGSIRKGGTETKQDLRDLLGTKAPPIPCFLFAEKDFSLLGLP